jgi:hypothetical protein
MARIARDDMLVKVAPLLKMADDWAWLAKSLDDP